MPLAFLALQQGELQTNLIASMQSSHTNFIINHPLLTKCTNKYTQEFWRRRNEEREEAHQAAYLAHDNSRGRLSNIYANTRRVAGLMTAFEDDDYKLQVSERVHTAATS